MNYTEAINYIHSAPKLSKPLGNENLKLLLKELGSPELRLSFVHIAGTNGKGSVSAMTDSVLRYAGYKTGLFTSPFIERFNERIKVNGEDIENSRLAEITTKVSDTIKKMNIQLAEFSLIFVIALLYFSEKECDIVVLETGLGGRLDATNAIEKSVVSAITSIGFDHMQYLGSTIGEIAREKAGIIKSGGKVVLYPNPADDVGNIFEECSLEKSASITVCDAPQKDDDKLVYKNNKYTLSLKGEYQYSNACVCLEIIEVLRNAGYNISGENVCRGLENTVWPGRFEWLSEKLLLDGCHNIDGVREFAKSVAEFDKPITVVTGVMEDKDYFAIAEILSHVTKNIIITKCKLPRALDPYEYKKVFEKLGVKAEVCECSEEAVKMALERNGICAVCGSLYLIGEVRHAFKNKTAH